MYMGLKAKVKEGHSVNTICAVHEKYSNISTAPL